MTVATVERRNVLAEAKELGRAAWLVGWARIGLAERKEAYMRTSELCRVKRNWGEESKKGGATWTLIEPGVISRACQDFDSCTRRLRTIQSSPVFDSVFPSENCFGNKVLRKTVYFSQRSEFSKQAALGNFKTQNRKVVTTVSLSHTFWRRLKSPYEWWRKSKEEYEKGEKKRRKLSDATAEKKCQNDTGLHVDLEVKECTCRTEAILDGAMKWDERWNWKSGRSIFKMLCFGAWDTTQNIKSKDY